MWHRVGPGGPSPHEVVPTVSVERFRAQVAALQSLGRIVPLGVVEEAAAAARPAIALTFDDDYATHARHALPVLVELGLPATFFLSGRWLHGLGAYWWEALEQEIAADGLDEVAARYGVPPRPAPKLAASLYGTAAVERLTRAAAAADAATLDADGAAAIAAAGMEIGFHTVDHPVLTHLGGDAVRRCLERGRAALASAVDRPLVRFAYPHGLADERVAAVAAAVGYKSAWTTGGRATAAGDHPHRRPRWDPGQRDGDATLLGALRRLVRRAEVVRG